MDAVRYFGSSTNDTSDPVGLQDWSYAYDNIGNRTGTTKANAAANYTANALNQYTERSVPDSSDIIGSAETNVTVTVNTNTATRQDYYWYHRLEVDNLYTAAYPQVVVEAIYDPGTNDPYVVSSETGNVFVAESPEVFSYDDDGNLLSDGRFDYTWDGENRLISAETIEGLPATVPIVHVEFEYDYMSRRTGKYVYEWDAGITNWTQTDARSFLYDGWNVISEAISNQTSTITNSYVWGQDLSGSLQGAGGIGGLLAVVEGTNAYFPTFDGNGNVSEYLDASGDIVAHYEYSPFGETIVASGPMKDDFAFRFSTKYFDPETGLYYYGYRFYNPPLGRWASRDPMEQPNCDVYIAFENNPISYVDVKGLFAIQFVGRWNDETKSAINTEMSSLRRKLVEANARLVQAISAIESANSSGCPQSTRDAMVRYLKQLRANARHIHKGLIGSDPLSLELINDGSSRAGTAECVKYGSGSKAIRFNVHPYHDFFQEGNRAGIIYHELYHYYFGITDELDYAPAPSFNTGVAEKMIDDRLEWNLWLVQNVLNVPILQLARTGQAGKKICCSIMVGKLFPYGH